MRGGKEMERGRKRGRDCITAREARQTIRRINDALSSVDAAIAAIILENWRDQLEQILDRR